MIRTFALLAAEAAEEEHNPIIPAANELIFGTIAFLLLLGLLWWGGVFKRIGAALEERRRRIEGHIEEAERTRREAEELLERYRQQLAEARDESSRILEETRRSAEELRRQLQERAEAESQRILENARAEIRSERDRAARELRREVGTLAVQVAERLVQGSLDGDRQQRLVDAYIEELTAGAGGNGRGQD